MSILSYHITHRETPVVRDSLRGLGYYVVKGQCYDFVANLASRLEPMDIAARRAIIEAIDAALEQEQAAHG